MALVPLVTPDSEPDLLTTVALLEARGIPAFVRGGGMGGLYPGPQIASYNAKTILVAEEQFSEAMDLLKDVEQTAGVDDESPSAPLSKRSIGRMLFEFFLFGWFIPGSKRGSANKLPERTHDG